MDDLFAHARNTDPATSHKAAASVKRIKESQAVIMKALGNSGPMTDEEIYRQVMPEIPISVSGCRTRRKELVDLGFVMDIGERRYTKSGRQTIVWGLV
jgi:hypothetical protein